MTDHQLKGNNGDNNTSDIIKNLIIVGGEKGGVGKSFATKQMIGYILRQNWQEDMVCYDADPSVSDVYVPYQKFKDQWMRQALFSSDKYEEESGLKIFEEIKPLVILNLPSNVNKDFTNFCEKVGIFKEVTQKQLYETAYFFFISDGGYESIKLFNEHIKRYQGIKYLKTILVFNEGLNGSSKTFDYLNADSKQTNQLRTNIVQEEVPVILLPEMSPSLKFTVARLMDEGNVTFEELTTVGNSFTKIRESMLQTYFDSIDQLFNRLFKSALELQYAELVKQQKDKRTKDLLPL